MAYASQAGRARTNASVANQFYVYEHWRPDTNQCFYVGKGKGIRSNKMGNRNPHHMAIQAKLFSLGQKVEVIIINEELSERDAFDLEVSRIFYWRSCGVKLTNRTDGGEGLSNPCEETRRKIGLSKIGNKNMVGRVISDETRQKISFAHKGKTPNMDSIYKAAQANIGNKWNLGKKLSESTREKMSASRTGIKVPSRGRPKTQAQKDRLRLANTGKKMSPEAIEKTASASRRPVICITDGVEFRSAIDAGKHYGLFNHAKVAEVCRGVRKTAAGRIFQYIESIAA